MSIKVAGEYIFDMQLYCLPFTGRKDRLPSRRMIHHPGDGLQIWEVVERSVRPVPAAAQSATLPAITPLSGPAIAPWRAVIG